MKKNIDIILLIIFQIFFTILYMILAFEFLNETLFMIGTPSIILIFLILIYKRGQKRHKGESLWVWLFVFDIAFFTIIIPLLVSIVGAGLGVAMSPR